MPREPEAGLTHTLAGLLARCGLSQGRGMTPGKPHWSARRAPTAITVPVVSPVGVSGAGQPPTASKGPDAGLFAEVQTA